jgi:hypothetical protein
MEQETIPFFKFLNSFALMWYARLPRGLYLLHSMDKMSQRHLVALKWSRVLCVDLY